MNMGNVFYCNTKDKCMINECYKLVYKDYLYCYMHLLLNNINLQECKHEKHEKQKIIKELSMKYIDYEYNKIIYGIYNEDEYIFYKKYCKDCKDNIINNFDCFMITDILYPFGLFNL